jgi:hypothetical protein
MRVLSQNPAYTVSIIVASWNRYCAADRSHYIRQTRVLTMLESFPVTIIVTFQRTRDNRWQSGYWKVTGLIAGGKPATQGVCRETLRVGGPEEQHLWTGLSIRLHKDEVEGYYFNILGETPKVFVICNRKDDESLQPIIATLSHDEAASYLEGDAVVDPVPMPAELYRWVERYVLENYLPEKKRKRKRDSWKEAEGERSARR